MLALYVLTLGISSGLIGAFAHHVLTAQGYIPGYHAGLMLAGGVAGGYAAVQLGYLGLLRVLKPTRSGVLLLCESLSHAGAAVFAPYLLEMQVAWPHPALARAEPLVYLGGFAAIHAVLKLVSFFAALQGRPSGRLGALGWLATAGVFLLAAWYALGIWLAELEKAQPPAPEETAYYQAGSEHALARVMPEGCVLESKLAPYPGECLTLRWANLPETDTVLDRIYVTVTLQGKETSRISRSVALDERRWTSMRIPADRVPAQVRSCAITWHSEREPGWRRLVAFRPVQSSSRRVLLSGPLLHVAQGTDRSDRSDRSDGSPDAAPPSFVVFLVDGLGADCVGSLRGGSGASSGRDSLTPSVDRLVYGATAFSNAYTPAPEGAAAAMTVLTGLNPLRHGYLGARHGPLPESAQTLPELLAQEHYATAAFTEGDATGDLVFGSGAERGFELFDAAYATGEGAFSPTTDERAAGAAIGDDAAALSESPEVSIGISAGSKATLDKAEAWIDEHADIRFMVFVRLSELRDLLGEKNAANLAALRKRYGVPPAKESSVGAGDPRALYDAALAYLDRCLGALFKHLRDYEARKSTCIVVASSYGFDWRNRTPTVTLSESCLRVPLVLYLPDGAKNQRRDLVGLEDLAPTALKLAGARFSVLVDGMDLLAGPVTKTPIAAFGDPLRLTVRSDKWRLVWDTGAKPFITEPSAQRASPGQGRYWLYDVASRNRPDESDLSARYPEVARVWLGCLHDYLQKSSGAPPPAVSPALTPPGAR